MLDKLVDSKDRVEGKVEVVSGSEVAIPDEFYPKLEELQKKTDELDGARRELGRLMQVTNNIVNICNSTETSIKELRKELADIVKLGDGKWAIDFENKVFVAVADSMPNVV
jgi:hypothetical protein